MKARLFLAGLLTMAGAAIAPAETIYLGPGGQTVNGHPEVHTRTTLTKFKTIETGAISHISHVQLQSSWKAEVHISCRDWTTMFHPGSDAEFTIELTAEGGNLKLRGERFDLSDTASIETFIFGLSDGETILAAHRMFPNRMNQFQFVTGYLLAKACKKL